MLYKNYAQLTVSTNFALLLLNTCKRIYPGIQKAVQMFTWQTLLQGCGVMYIGIYMFWNTLVLYRVCYVAILSDDLKSWKFQISSPIRNLSLYVSNTDQVFISTSDCTQIDSINAIYMYSRLSVDNTLPFPYIHVGQTEIPYCRK